MYNLNVRNVFMVRMYCHLRAVPSHICYIYLFLVGGFQPRSRESSMPLEL